MEHLKTLLASQGLSVENIEEKVAEFGFDPQALTEEQAELIVAELAPPPLDKPQKGGLANTSPSSNGKPKSKKIGSLNEAIAYASKLSNQEIEDLETRVSAGRSQWVQQKARQIIHSIRSAPKEVIDVVKGELLEEEADLETFQSFADEINQAIFAISE